MYWSKRPMVRLLIWLVSGILTAQALSPFSGYGLWLWIPVVLLLVLILLKYYRPRRECCTDLLSGLLVASTGLVVMLRASADQGPFSFDDTTYEAVVSTVPVDHRASTTAMLQLIPTDSTDVRSVVNGMFFGRRGAEELRYGQVLLFKGRPVPLRGAQNPGAMDAAAWYARQGVDYQVVLHDEDWRVAGHRRLNFLTAAFAELRYRMVDQLSTLGLNPEEADVARAMLLGEDALMATTTKDQFAAAGVMHLLCVSGLHVGIVYLILNTILAAGRRWRWWQLIRKVLLLAGIWGYALLTGMEPPVQRAALMISFFILAPSGRGRYDSLNLLAATAVIILIWDPRQLFQAGFQLSYAAVTGILILYPWLHGLWHPSNRIFDRLWSLLLLSVTAQLSTLPLVIHYFHQFPVWFWLANVVVYPTAVAVVAAGLFFMILSTVPMAGMIAGMVLKGLLWLLTTSLDGLQQLPWLTLRHLPWDRTEVFLVYGLLAATVVTLRLKRLRGLWIILPLVLVLTGRRAIEHRRQEHLRGLVVHHVPQHTALRLLDGHRNLLMVDSLFAGDPSAGRYTTDPAITFYGLDTEVRMIPMEGGVNGYRTFTTMSGDSLIRVMVLTEAAVLHPGRVVLRPDLVVIHGSPRRYLAALPFTMVPGMVVTDGSVSRYWSRRVGDLCHDQGWDYHHTPESGALVWSDNSF